MDLRCCRGSVPILSPNLIGRQYRYECLRSLDALPHITTGSFGSSFL